MIVCGDSHTSTHGAFGALALGIGTSETEHVLVTQTLIQRKSMNMRAVIDGALPSGVTAKDLILALISEIGAAGAIGCALEFGGEAVAALSMEGRMTICNMSVEAGARTSIIAPDDKTFEYLKGRPKSPRGKVWDDAMRYWETLRSDESAEYNSEIRLDAGALPPLVTWGTTPEQVTSISGRVRGWRISPTATSARPPGARSPIWGLPAASGSPTSRSIASHRLLHQRAHRGSAQGGARGRRKGGNARVSAMVVPGSGLVKQQAEAEGLDRIFERRLRLARAGLLDVPRHESGQAQSRRALRVDVKPQFRGSARPQGPHPSGVAGHGGRRRDCREIRRRAAVAARAALRHKRLYPLTLRSLREQASRRMRPLSGLTVRDGPDAPPHHGGFDAVGLARKSHPKWRIGAPNQ